MAAFFFCPRVWSLVNQALHEAGLRLQFAGPRGGDSNFALEHLLEPSRRVG